MSLTRRQFMRISLGAGAGLVLLPSLAGRALADGSAASEDPHFFLLITLPNPSGLDSSYLFDARPLAMTQANLIQNYRTTGEPAPWAGSNGTSTLATDLTQPLVPYKSDFSVLNGVTMAVNFDGHDQNFNFLLAGDAFGGQLFVPHLNLSGPGHRPIDALQRGRMRATLNNTGGTVPLSPSSAARLVSSLRGVPPLDPASALFGFLSSRLAANAQGTGGLSLGSSAMAGAFGSAPGLAGMLGGLQITGADTDPDFVRMAGQFFRAGAAKAAILTIDTGNENFDTHDVSSASAQPRAYSMLANSLAAILKTLRETPYDASRSLMDVTTFLFSAEFGRTLRQDGKPMNATGTDHNPLSNSVLIGGKGIRGGQVIGASDFASAGETLSPAHLSMDSLKLKAMGRPFDFGQGVPRTDLPAEFKAGDYLTFGSVVNTIYGIFGVDPSKRRLVERNGAVAPAISALLG